MFLLNASIVKATKNGQFLDIEGIATDPVIDKDSERMSEDAIKKMADSVNKGNIPIRIEHENKVYTEVGMWKSASLNEQGKMVVKGTLDLGWSLARDVEYALSKGYEIGLSIGGKVAKAGMEFAKDVGHMIRRYDDVILDEITITKRPAVGASTLSIAKSVRLDNNTLSQTDEALLLEKERNGFSKVDEMTFKKENLHLFLQEQVAKETGADEPHKAPTTHSDIHVDSQSARKREILEEVLKPLVEDTVPGKVTNTAEETPALKMEGTKGMDMARSGTKGERGDDQNPPKVKVSKWSDKLDIMRKAVKKCCEEFDISCDPDCCDDDELTSDDIRLITIIAEVVSNVDVEDVQMPKDLEDWQLIESLPGESFVIELPGRQFPHHNADFTLNNDWLEWGLACLLDGDYPWLTAKEYSLALMHLYHHYRMENLPKKAKKAMSTGDSGAESTNALVRENEEGGKKKKKVKKSESVEKEEGVKTFEQLSDELTEGDWNLMKACHAYYTLQARNVVTKEDHRPQVDGNDLSDKVIKSLADAYVNMMQFRNSKHTLGSTFAWAFRKKIPTDQKGVAEGQEAVADMVQKSMKKQLLSTPSLSSSMKTNGTVAKAAGTGKVEPEETKINDEAGKKGVKKDIAPDQGGTTGVAKEKNGKVEPEDTGVNEDEGKDKEVSKGKLEPEETGINDDAAAKEKEVKKAEAILALAKAMKEGDTEAEAVALKTLNELLVPVVEKAADATDKAVDSAIDAMEKQVDKLKAAQAKDEKEDEKAEKAKKKDEDEEEEKAEKKAKKAYNDEDDEDDMDAKAEKAKKKDEEEEEKTEKAKKDAKEAKDMKDNEDDIDTEIGVDKKKEKATKSKDGADAPEAEISKAAEGDGTEEAAKEVETTEAATPSEESVGKKKKADEEDDEDEEDMKKMQSVAEKAVAAAIESQVTPMFEKLGKSITEITELVKASQESVTKSHNSELETLKKSVEQQGTDIKAVGELLGKIAKTAAPRKSVAFETLEKSFTRGSDVQVEALSEQDEITKCMDEQGMTFQQAYSHVKKMRQANAQQ